MSMQRTMKRANGAQDGLKAADLMMAATFGVAASRCIEKNGFARIPTEDAEKAGVDIPALAQRNGWTCDLDAEAGEHVLRLPGDVVAHRQMFGDKLAAVTDKYGEALVMGAMVRQSLVGQSGFDAICSERGWIATFMEDRDLWHVRPPLQVAAAS